MAPEPTNPERHKWTTTMTISANDRNFPATGVTTAYRAAGLLEGDLEAMLSGIYATAVGCLVTFDGSVATGQSLGFASPTLATPLRSYSGHFNFFDPDCYFLIGALLVSGNPYLHSQARRVIEQSAAHQVRI